MTDEELKPFFLEHFKVLRKQAREGLEQSLGDARWRELLSAVDAAEGALNGVAGRYELALLFMTLGHEAEAVTMSDRGVVVMGMNALMEKRRRDRPLTEKSNKAKAMIGVAQEVAADLWRDDITHSIRLADMCERVYRVLIPFAAEKNIIELLPEKVEGIKPWLRPVAPAYAQKRGRPKSRKC